MILFIRLIVEWLNVISLFCDSFSFHMIRLFMWFFSLDQSLFMRDSFHTIKLFSRDVLKWFISFYLILFIFHVILSFIWLVVFSHDSFMFACDSFFNWFLFFSHGSLFLHLILFIWLVSFKWILLFDSFNLFFHKIHFFCKDSSLFACDSFTHDSFFYFHLISFHMWFFPSSPFLSTCDSFYVVHFFLHLITYYSRNQMWNGCYIYMIVTGLRIILLKSGGNCVRNPVSLRRELNSESAWYDICNFHTAETRPSVTQNLNPWTSPLSRTGSWLREQ